MILTQTRALLTEAYRELRARKLFWVVMALSGLFVAAFGALGINERGLTVLWFDLPIADLANAYSAGLVSRAMFYKFLFLTMGFGIWLTWAATILAIISTASMVPDMVSSGSIELTLSRPIGRVRLLLTRYLGGLLFMALQVTVFTLLSLVVIALRGGGWVWSLLWAPPFLVLFFSFFYCVSALVGLVTRSAIAAIIAASLVWLLVMGLAMAEPLYLRQMVQREQIITLQNERLESTARDIERARAEGFDPDAVPGNTPRGGRSTTLTQSLGAWQDRLALSQTKLKTLRSTHAMLFALASVLPKASQTMGMLESLVITGPEMERFVQLTEPDHDVRSLIPEDTGVRVSSRGVTRETKKILDQRGPAWIIGTSLLFQFVVLGVACWIFRRQDN